MQFAPHEACKLYTSGASDCAQQRTAGAGRNLIAQCLSHEMGELRSSLWQSADDHHGSQLPWWRGVRCRYAHVNRLICCQSRHKQADTAGRQGAGLLPMFHCVATCHRGSHAHCQCMLQSPVHTAGLLTGVSVPVHTGVVLPAGVCVPIRLSGRHAGDQRLCGALHRAA